jgi:hypothetical protein
MEPPPGVFATLFDFSFNEFVTTRLIKFLYALGMIVAAVGSLGFVVRGFASSIGTGFVCLLVSPMAFLLYVLLIRIWLEVLIVIFRIAEHLREIENQGRKTPAA